MYEPITGKELIEKCGMLPVGKGFDYLVIACNLRLQNPRMNAMNLYQTIAEHNNDTASRVERAIRYTIGRSSDLVYQNLPNGTCINTICVMLRGDQKWKNIVL